MIEDIEHSISYRIQEAVRIQSRLYYDNCFRLLGRNERFNAAEEFVAILRIPLKIQINAHGGSYMNGNIILVDKS